MISEPGDGRIYVTTPDGLWSFNSSAHNVPRAAFDALRERCEKLEWLVEVQEFYMYRLRNPGGWSTPGMERAKIGVAWQRRSAANAELRAMHMDALAATEVK